MTARAAFLSLRYHALTGRIEKSMSLREMFALAIERCMIALELSGTYGITIGSERS